jgi:peptidoglycan/LPS O-acetylase OafA/YrhL
VLAELLFVQNYFPGLWGHTWSLAVEEHFYLLLAILLWLLSKRDHTLRAFRLIPAIFLVMAIGCLALRLLNAPIPFDFQTHIDRTHLRMDSLFAGVFISYLHHRHPAEFELVTTRWRWPLIAAGILFLSPAFVWPHETSVFIRTFGLTMFHLGSGCLLAGFLALKLPSWPLITAVAYIGSHSYSIYIWHEWVEAYLEKTVFRAGHWHAGAALFFAVSIVFGIVMALAVEFPVLKLRDRWFPSRGRAV